MKLSDNSKLLQPSGTMEFFAKVAGLQQKGFEVISLSAGELSENTPKKVKQAGINAIQNNNTRYTVNSGLAILRQRIAENYSKKYKVNYTANQVLISNGGKQALYNCLFSLVGKGDEVIIFSPYYPSFAAQVRLCGAEPIIVPLYSENGYQISEKELVNHLTGKTKTIIINSPNNPTGAILNKESLNIVIEIALKHDLWIISDEIYEKIIFEPSALTSLLGLNQEIYDRTVIINSFSKSYAMTGWRVGYCLGPESIIKKAEILQSQTTSNVCTISQHAAIAALENEDRFAQDISKILIEKKNKAIEILKTIKNISLFEPQGAFYLFVDIRELDSGTKKVNFANSADVADYLLDEYHVAVVSGESFGTPGFLRISFAADMKKIELGCQRIKKGLEQLTQ